MGRHYWQWEDLKNEQVALLIFIYISNTFTESLYLVYVEIA